MAKRLIKVQVLLLRPCVHMHTVKVNINNVVHNDAQIFIIVFVCICFERAWFSDSLAVILSLLKQILHKIIK